MASVCPNCGSTVDPGASVCFHCRAVLDAFTAGARIADRYVIEAAVGQGGMGRVYRAFDEILHERVAIKTLLPEFARDPSFVARFRDEVRLARKVSHPNVCRVHDYVDHAGTPFLSMEWVEGETMASRLSRLGPRPGQEIASVLNQAAPALRAMWNNGIVHRDLKPANLMWTPEGRLKLMDMGLARAVRADQARDKTSGIIGSPDYLSPEQIRGENATEASDVYALGTTLYELAVGRPPFRGDTPAQTLARHLSDEPDSAPLARLGEDLKTTILRSLAKDPKSRPDLQGASGKGTVLIERDRESRRGGMTTPIRIASIVVAVIVLSAFVIIPMVHRDDRRDEESPATPRSGMTPIPGTPSQTPAPIPSPSLTPSVEIAAATPTPRPAATARESPTPQPTAPTPAQTPPAPPIAQASETPSPARAATPVPTLAPTATPPPTPTPDAKLIVLVSPWADVHINGELKGQTPLAPISLPPGTYVVELRHPDYRPYSRTVRLNAGETQRLTIDLRTDGVRR